MRVIIDSNVFIFLLSQPDRLSTEQRSIVGDRTNELLLSFSSVWEIIIKSSIGKLQLPVPPEQLFGVALEQFSVQLFPIVLGHLLKVHSLPLHHRDPFDRLIIAQAMVEALPVLSSDPQFPAYDIDVIR